MPDDVLDDIWLITMSNLPCCQIDEHKHVVFIMKIESGRADWFHAWLFIAWRLLCIDVDCWRTSLEALPSPEVTRPIWGLRLNPLYFRSRPKWLKQTTMALFLLVLGTLCHSQPYNWTLADSANSMPHPVYKAATIADGTFIYMLGGDGDQAKTTETITYQPDVILSGSTGHGCASISVRVASVTQPTNK